MTLEEVLKNKYVCDCFNRYEIALKNKDYKLIEKETKNLQHYKNIYLVKENKSAIATINHIQATMLEMYKNDN